MKFPNAKYSKLNDFFKNLNNHKDFLPLGTGGHYNPYGYNKITMHIYKSISR